MSRHKDHPPFIRIDEQFVYVTQSLINRIYIDALVCIPDVWDLDTSKEERGGEKHLTIDE